MKFIIDIKRKIFNNPKIKKQFFKYCSEFADLPDDKSSDIEHFYKIFGKYIFESENFADEFFDFAANLSSIEKKDFLLNIIRTAIVYRSHGKIKPEYLRTKEEKKAIEAADEFLSKVVECGDYYELNGYKLPKEFFLREVFYDRLFLENTNKDYYANKDIIDAGACIGDSALILSEYTSKNVYAFEPCENNYNLMLKTIELNNIKNIVPVKSALGDENSTLNLKNYDSNNTGGLTFLPDSNLNLISEEQVKTVTLDSFVEENNLEIGLIKSDIEGFEQKLLAGAQKTIVKFKPTLLICIYHNPSDFFKIKTIIENWNLNYKISYIPAKSTGHYIAETILKAEIEPSAK